jgi:hypothetical protein
MHIMDAVISHTGLLKVCGTVALGTVIILVLRKLKRKPRYDYSSIRYIYALLFTFYGNHLISPGIVGFTLNLYVTVVNSGTGDMPNKKG